MTTAAYLIIAALFLATIGMQAWYLYTYREKVTTATRVVVVTNISLLTALLLGLGVWAVLAGRG